MNLKNISWSNGTTDGHKFINPIQEEPFWGSLDMPYFGKNLSYTLPNEDPRNI